MPENNGKQNPEELYTIKYQKHVACSYGYKSVCVDDKFSNSKPFKIYLGKDPVYNFINSMIEESKYCRLVNKNMEILKIILNVGSVTVIMLIMMLKEEIIVLSLEDIEALHIEIAISILNHKTPIKFHNLKNYDSDLIMQELGKFNHQCYMKWIRKINGLYYQY